jgi:cytochrome c-type biogenesis protein CcmH/NrfF
MILVLLVTGGACFGQTASDLESPAVNRVANRLLCSCGCKDRMTCRMEPYPCGMCRAAKTRIFKMQQAGMADQAILDAFVKESGPDVLAVDPGRIGSLLSYSALVIGLLLVVWFIRKYRKPAAVPEAPAEDELVARYREQIEKDIAKLD